MASHVNPSTYDVLGRVGLPAPVSELAARRWDAVVVGGGHNGLTAAAYLAGAGKAVLVLERREQLGGACTLERPFEDPRFLVSPCAYLVGLLHPLVIEELDLPRYGYRTFVCDPTQWTPFEDGTSLTQWRDSERTAKEIHTLAPGDVDAQIRRRRRKVLGEQASGEPTGSAPELEDRRRITERAMDDELACGRVLVEALPVLRRAYAVVQAADLSRAERVHPGMMTRWRHM